YIEYSSSHHSFNKGLTVHGTHNAQITANVVYENLGHSYFLEDGGEYGNQFSNNLAINARKPSSQAAATEKADFTNPSNYWMENGLNYFHGNHAAGSEGPGFWFDMRGLNGLSSSNNYRSQYEAYDSKDGPQVGYFEGNTSHSIAQESLGLNHAGLVRSESHKGSDAQPQAVTVDWYIEDFTSYKVNLGIYIRGIGGNFNNIKIAEADDGTRLRLNQAISNSLIVGRTDNIGDPSAPTWSASEGRTLPNQNGNFTGHQLYDGPAGLDNVHFAGFSGPNDYAIRESNAVHKAATHYVNRLSFASDVPFSHRLHYGSSFVEVKGLVDLDGSLSGTAKASLIGELRSNNLLGRSSNGQFNQDWGANISSDVSFGSMKLRGSELDTDNTEVTISRSDGATTGSFRVASNNEQSLFAVGGSYSYKMEFTDAPSQFQFYVNDLPMGEGIIYEIAGLNIDSRFSVGHEAEIDLIRETSSLARLQAATSTSIFRDRPNAKLYIKFVAQMRHGWLFPQPRMTIDNKLMGGVLVNVNSSRLMEYVSIAVLSVSR
ncbi:MAG: hypothetical protein AAFN10_28535, partial [Bacteroidota bacterium]